MRFIANCDVFARFRSQLLDIHDGHTVEVTVQFLLVGTVVSTSL